jgi:magnesium-protoporphyrin IX monomethyl ester (oxidative) cyclase
VRDVDRVPVPDYDDYFAALSETPLHTGIFPALLVETSRGCWWGEKHHCTFCGLNGDEMAYRPKSVGRVLEELDLLARRYATHRFLVVDNILHRQHLKTLIPALIEARISLGPRSSAWRPRECGACSRASKACTSTR